VIRPVDDRAHANLAGFLRWLATIEDGARLLDRDGAVAVAGQADWPSARVSVRTGGALEPAAWADAVSDFFAQHGSTGCAYLRSGVDDDLAADLTARGFHEFGDTPEMVCEERLDHRPPPAGITVRLAQEAADVEAYARVASKAFVDLGFLEGALFAQLNRPGALLHPDVAVSLAELDGEPVAGALSVLVGEQRDGYVGWVSCLAEARGRGLGDTVTRAVTNAAFDRGARIVTLEASRFGESTYRRMGYRELYRYRMFVRI
jgi:ribosomal protein S18 acetylase RimI-like enzyme